MRSFTQSFICLFMHLFTSLFVRSLILSFVTFFDCSFIHFFVFSFDFEQENWPKGKQAHNCGISFWDVDPCPQSVVKSANVFLSALHECYRNTCFGCSFLPNFIVLQTISGGGHFEASWLVSNHAPALPDTLWFCFCSSCTFWAHACT